MLSENLNRGRALKVVSTAGPLDLEGCGPFREQYLELSHKLASDGCNAALDAILV